MVGRERPRVEGTQQEQNCRHREALQRWDRKRHRENRRPSREAGCGQRGPGQSRIPIQRAKDTWKASRFLRC